MIKRFLILLLIFIAPLAYTLIKAQGFNQNSILSLCTGIFEILAIYAVFFYIQRNRRIKGLITLVSIILLAAYWSQSISLAKSLYYITPLALENYSYIFLVVSPAQLFGIIFITALTALGIEYFCRKATIFSWKLVLFLLVCMFVSNRIAYSPIYQIYRSYTRIFVMEVNFPQTLALYEEFHGEVNNTEYPFLKENVYEKPLPFSTAEGASPDQAENVIIFFFEGLPARLLEPYGGEFQGLTPSFDEFAKHENVMLVDNYFNHTAATFRGIQGSLSSGFPLYGGWDGGSGWADNNNADFYSQRNLITVASILQDKDYENTFFIPHPSSDSLVPMLSYSGFESIYTQEDSLELFLGNNNKYLQGNDLTDEGSLLALTRFLQSEPKTPFLIGFYNIGTHAFMDIPEQGIPYKDGANPVLNTLHNADIHFGTFWEYFLDSPYAENTYVIITTDHSHYPEPPMIEVAGENFRPFFFDEIPLMIYDPNKNLPNYLDAQNRTSIDLAPTILHIMEINEENTFLGNSLFEESQLPMTLYVSGSEFHILDEQGLPIAIDGEDLDPALKVIVDLYQYCDSRNKLAPPR